MPRCDTALLLLLVCFCLRIANAQDSSGSEGRVLFEDDFKTSDNWEIINGEWEIESGTFKAKGTPSHFAIAGDEGWANYSVQVTTKILGSTNPKINWLKSYLFFRVQDPQNFYRFGIHGDGNVVDLYKCVDGKWIHLANASFTPKKEKWYTFRVEVAGEKIKGYVDKKLLIDAEDDAFQNGKIGLGVLEDDMQTVYKHVVVKALGEGTFSPLSISLLQRQLIYKDVIVNLRSTRLLKLAPSELRAKVELFSASTTAPVKTESVRSFDEKYKASVRFDISGLAPGEYEVRSTLLDRGGKILGDASSKFRILSFPWAGSKAGITDEVLAPWTPMEVEGNKIKCWARTYDLSHSILPADIQVSGSSILSGPIKLNASINKKSISILETRPSIITRSKSKVVLKAGTQLEKLKVSGNVLIEYDGMLRIDLTFDPEEEITLENLFLQVPVKKEFATLYHYWPGVWGNATNSGELPRQGLNLPFRAFVWLGNEDLGLGWFAETNEKWNNRDANNAIRIERNSGAVIMNIYFIDKPLKINSSLSYTFGLQATPVKPYPEGWRQWHIMHGAYYGIEKPARPKPSDTISVSVLEKLKKQGVNTIVYHEDWTDIQNYPETTHKEELRSLVSECHRLGMKILVYFGYELSDIAPEFDACNEETLRKVPGEKFWGWYYTRNPPQKDYGVCYNSPWQDFLAEGIKYVLDTYDIDGVYLDGTMEPFGCQNFLHGCGYKDKNGSIQGTFPVFAVRNLMKRIYAICTKKGGLVNVHNSTCCVAPTLSFSTSYWDGEHLQEAFKNCKKPAEFLNVLPLSAFRAEFMGRNWGVPAEFLVYESGKWKFDSGLAITLLHDILVRPYTHTMGKIPKIWKAMDEFGVDAKDCTWHPYWNNSELIKVVPEGTFASIYIRKGKGALIAVSNLTDTAQEVRIKPDFSKLGLKKENIQVTNAIAGNTIPLSEEGEIITNILKFNWQLLLLK